jgi:RNA polymerase sigma-70 factor (ECF subfamily)
MIPQPGLSNRNPHETVSACNVVGPEELIKQLARNDRRAALELLTRRYTSRLQAHAARILHDEAEARDVVQEVLIKAIKEPRLFDADFRIQAWLFRVTRNLCFNLSRDRRRRQGLLNINITVRSSVPDQIERIFGEQRKEEMLLAFEQISAEHREILTLRYYDDLSYAEIAETLRIKLGTVMSRLSRARERLMAVLEEEGEMLAAG